MSPQMHCTACVVLMEEELIKHDKVAKVSADAGRREIIVQGDFDDIELEELALELTPLVSDYGYEIIPPGGQIEPKVNMREWAVALVVATAFVGFVKFLEGANLFDFVTTNESGGLPLSMVFVIGLIASVSSCMAVTGGVVLAISQSYAKSGAVRIPQTMFHVGRLIGFAVLGSLLGYAGSQFTLSVSAIMIMQGVLAAFMLLLGLNILGVPFAQRLTPTLPKTFGAKVLGLGRLQYRIAPFILGALTFFLPCGFTQSMQLYALSSGSPTSASIIMLTFALGTLPVLLALSFGSRFVKQSKLGLFYKVAGLLVVMFALMTLIGLLRALGVI